MPLKNVKKIFLFCSRLWRGWKRWARFLPFRAEILAQKRFALRSVIATNQDISNFQGKEFARSPRLRRGERANKLPSKFAMFKLVGVSGLEPPAFRTPCERASQLRHTPIFNILILSQLFTLDTFGKSLFNGSYDR